MQTCASWKIGLVAAVLGVASAASAEATAAKKVPAAEVRQGLYASCFLDPQEGWMVGDLGRIFHTTDGGNSWEVRSAGGKRPFAGVACTDRQNVWVAGQGGQIAHSGDGGVTWANQTSTVSLQLLDIAFVNAKLGLAVGDFGTLLRTEDGGANWSKVALPPDVHLPPDVAEVTDPGDVLLYDISFVDAEHVWIAGEFGVILGSSDGGRSWVSQLSGVETTLFGVHFADTQRGWAVGIDAVMLHTTDGGASWKKADVPKPRGVALALYDVGVLGSYGYAVGASGLVLTSRDAGETWQLGKVPVQLSSVWLRGVEMFPEGRGFIVGATGMMLRADRDTLTPSKQRF